MSGVARAADIRALRARREALLARLAAIRADIGRGLDRDSGERAIELENAEVLDEIARLAEIELGDIDARIAEARTGERV